MQCMFDVVIHVHRGLIVFTQQSWDKQLWIEDIKSKSSSAFIDDSKTDIYEKDIYDNRPSSRILIKARTNTLQLNDRNRHVNKETHCMRYRTSRLSDLPSSEISGCADAYTHQLQLNPANDQHGF